MRRWINSIGSWLRGRLMKILNLVVPTDWVHRLMWVTQPKFVVAVAVVVWHDNHVLLLKHSYRPRYPWGLPTGWMRYGEDVRRAAMRELHEETGIIVDSDAFVYFYTHFPYPNHMEIGFWVALDDMPRAAITPSSDGEIIEAQWVVFGQWPEGLFPNQIPIIIDAHRQRNQRDSISP